MSQSFLRQYAETQRFSLGQPRSFSIAGDRIFFVRSKSGTDSCNCLWMIDMSVPIPEETLLVDPRALGTMDEASLPDAERKRRERMRESAGGILSYSVAKDGNRLAFVLNGDIYLLDIGAAPTLLAPKQGAFDPRLSPDGQWLAYSIDGALTVIASDGNSPARIVAADDDPDITWGQADFIASEEMDRLRGYWWSPDSTRILATKVDTRPVSSWHISDPGDPAAAPTTVRYPAAGTDNAITTLANISISDGTHIPVVWDNDAYPYLVDVSWGHDTPTLTVQTRDQKTMCLLGADIQTGKTSELSRQDDNVWIDIVPGFPAQLADGRLLSLVDEPQARRMAIDGTLVTPGNSTVRSFVGVQTDGTVVITAYEADPKVWRLFQILPDGTCQPLLEPSVCGAILGDDWAVVLCRNLESVRVDARAYRITKHDWQEVLQISTNPTEPNIVARPQFFRSREHALETALLLPTGYDGTSKLPVLMDPYGGPHAQRVLSALSAYLEAQWLADQGFAVVIVDGRGSPGHSPEWEKAIAGGKLLDIAIEDQVEALQDLAATHSMLDLDRVAIRGWSFGGYLAAGAVLHRPDIFHAAIAGAPVTDWHLYDTHYTERYLGDPAHNAEAYDHTSLIKHAQKLTRPLMLIHGLADDNVVFANTLQFSQALLAAGRPHRVLPLSNTTHAPSSVAVTEHLAALEMQFLRDSLQG